MDINSATLLQPQENLEMDEINKFVRLKQLKNVKVVPASDWREKQINSWFKDNKLFIFDGYDMISKVHVRIQMIQIEYEQCAIDQLKEQLQKLQNLEEHFCLSKLIRFFFSQENQYLFLLWKLSDEVFEDITSFSKREAFNIDELKRTSRNLFAGLDFLHRQGIYHEYIIPEYIMIDSNCKATIIGYGINQILSKINQPLRSEIELEDEKKGVGCAKHIVSYMWANLSTHYEEYFDILDYFKKRYEEIQEIIGSYYTSHEIAKHLGWRDDIIVKKKKFGIEIIEGAFVDEKQDGHHRHNKWNTCVTFIDWQNGEECKRGVCYFSNMSFYDGDWKVSGMFKQINQFQGQGQLYWKKEKTTYIGEFNNHKREGYGIQKTQFPKTELRGVFKNNSLQGIGESTIDGQLYLGQFQNSKRHGIGKYFWLTGDVYNGKWKKDLMNGNGQITYKTGQIIEGYFKNGILEGEGTMYHTNGDYYQGYLKNITYDGKGELYFAKAKQTYIGMFVQGFKEGLGKVINANGEVIEEGLYQRGMLKKKMENLTWKEKNSCEIF